jgi:hypothetical protein
MRRQVVGLLVLGFVAFLTLSLIRGQERQGSPSAAPTPSSPPAVVQAVAKAPRDFSKLPALQKEMLVSAQAGADWLFRMNTVKGRFLYGYLPALKCDMEGDHFLRQIGAAFALARAARYTGEDRFTARATQAILALLDETVVEGKDPAVRHTSLPSLVVNRLSSAGLLVLAISELPAPQADLLDKSEELCHFIRAQQRTDGSLRCNDASTDDKSGSDDLEAVNEYPGIALCALMRSQLHRAASWKTDAVTKAAAFYRPYWQAHKTMRFVPWQSAACCEAYLKTKDAKLAEFVNEMNDWICTLQYSQIDPRHMLWYGGFMTWTDGRLIESPPEVSSAVYAESLVEACRVARESGDVQRHQRYSEAVVRCLQFLGTVQYTDANSQHFADWYRPRVLGGFHASHQDGNLRIDYTQHAVLALVQYLEYVAP